VTAPLFLAEELDGDEVVLTGPEGRHAAKVRRLRVGERVDLADGRGTRARCEVTVVAVESVRLRVLEREQEPLPSPRVVLVQALAKGDRGELAVELATEIGVDEIVPWAAERCVVRWEGARGDKARERWRSTVREAAKQSRRARLPVVAPLVSTDELVRRAAARPTLVLHEQAATPLASVPLPADGELLLVVGPEGGLSDRELAQLVTAGGVPVRLGPSVLRTSTAGAAAIAVVSARTARWSG
jgi:16S rRNA (uracil1498-N3)-methyltransferase